MAVHFYTWIDEALIYARECMQELPGTPANAVYALRQAHPRSTMTGSFDKTVRDMDADDMRRILDEVRHRWPHRENRA